MRDFSNQTVVSGEEAGDGSVTGYVGFFSFFSARVFYALPDGMTSYGVICVDVSRLDTEAQSVLEEIVPSLRSRFVKEYRERLKKLFLEFVAVVLRSVHSAPHSIKPELCAPPTKEYVPLVTGMNQAEGAFFVLQFRTLHGSSFLFAGDSCRIPARELWRSILCGDERLQSRWLEEFFEERPDYFKCVKLKFLGNAANETLGLSASARDKTEEESQQASPLNEPILCVSASDDESCASQPGKPKSYTGSNKEGNEAAVPAVHVASLNTAPCSGEQVNVADRRAGAVHDFVAGQSAHNPDEGLKRLDSAASELVRNVLRQMFSQSDALGCVPVEARPVLGFVTVRQALCQNRPQLHTGNAPVHQSRQIPRTVFAEDNLPLDDCPGLRQNESEQQPSKTTSAAKQSAQVLLRTLIGNFLWAWSAASEGVLLAKGCASSGPFYWDDKIGRVEASLYGELDQILSTGTFLVEKTIAAAYADARGCTSRLTEEAGDKLEVLVRSILVKHLVALGHHYKTYANFKHGHEANDPEKAQKEGVAAYSEALNACLALVAQKEGFRRKTGL